MRAGGGASCRRAGRKPACNASAQRITCLSDSQTGQTNAAYKITTSFRRMMPALENSKFASLRCKDVHVPTVWNSTGLKVKAAYDINEYVGLQ